MCGWLCLYVLLLSANSPARSEVIDFGSDRWILKNASIIEHMGRKCLMGTAYLNDVKFENGAIEFDIAVNGSRSYPGVLFRMQSEENYERVYLRPHRESLYPDAIQYTPVINKIEAWQLYNGEGYTAGAKIPANQWIHVKVEISGKQARVYLDQNDEPSLVVHDLKHGISEGTVGLIGPMDETAYFSNFEYRIDNAIEFEDPPEIETPPGMITEWELSKAFPAGQVDLEQTPYPRFFTIFYGGWRKVETEPPGLLNVSRYAKRSGQAPDCVLARHIFRSDEIQDLKLSFGYSDEAAVYLNGKKVFYGNSAYRYRDPSFVGIIGLYDHVYLTLEKGLNEIFLIVKEKFGGWGFMCKADRKLDVPVKQHDRLTKAWETPADFLTPESVLYDPKRDVLYVTSFDFRYKADAKEEEYTGFISKVKLNGEIEELKWVTHLHAPCGMGIHKNKLFTVERGNLVEIDLKSGKILERYPIPGSEFVNDLAIDSRGNIYISDTSPSSHIDSRIFKYKDGKFEVWMDSEEINRANGLYVHDGNLLVGNTGDGRLKSIDLDNKKISTITCLGAGVVDGIRIDRDGNYIVSHWEGQTYVVSQAGEVVEILDTMETGLNSADFEFIKDKDLLIIPTFVGNKVVAYRLSK